MNYQFGAEDTLVQKMQSVKRGTLSDVAQRIFAEYMANTTRTPHRVAVGWLQAVHGITERFRVSKAEIAALEAEFPEYARVLLADAPEFLAEVLAVFEAVTNE